MVREHLRERVEEGRRLPLVLVSAPAGYGKTRGISDWLAWSEAPCAWGFLGPELGDPGLFI